MTADNSKGYIIGIEGIDAVGKNTHSTLLSSWLERNGIKSVSMSFPDYETIIGREIRAFLSREKSYPIELQHLLFAANRWEKSEEIRSHIQSGKTIIVNRYTESNLAYGLANGLDIEWLTNLEKGLPKTNLVIVLDAAPQSLKSRRTGSSKDAYEKNSALQNKAQKAYRELARENGWRLVDADASVEEVQHTLLKIVRNALGRAGKMKKST
jgi:dTMP kinase